MGAVTLLDQPRNLDLIKKTVAKDCDRNSDGVDLHLGEFDLFITTCRELRLDPLRRQVYVFIFDKDDPGKRRMVLVTAIAGYRSIAERTNNYMPGPARCHVDEALKDHDGNPEGIEYAEVTVKKFAHGDWHDVTERAYWTEFAPIKGMPSGGYDWQDTGETYPDGHKKAGKPIMRKIAVGKLIYKLDERKDNWRRMPRVMLEKCAEAKALRRAWPDDFAGLYVEDELDRSAMIDITPTEAAEQAAADTKLNLIGGKDAITVDWCKGGPLARIALKEFAEEVLKYANAKDLSPEELRMFWHRNLPARGEFKAKAGSDYLSLQREIEGITEQKEKALAVAEAAE